MSIVLNYKKNAFFIEQFGSKYNAGESVFLPIEGITRLLDGGSIREDKASTLECIKLKHELFHFIQDLSNFSCITEGHFRDHLAAFIIYLSNVDVIKFPYFEESNLIHNRKQNLTREENEYRDYLETFYDIYCCLFKKEYNKPSYLSLDIDMDGLGLSFTDLLETQAKNKSFWDAFRLAKNEDECEMLHELSEEEKLFPILIKDSKLNTDPLILEGEEEYQLVNHIMREFLLKKQPHINAIYDYLKHYFPLNVRGTAIEFIYKATSIILEASMNIPSFDYIVNQVKGGRYDVNVFCPPMRFYKIIQTIHDNGGFPEKTEGEDFFITFHNWVSEKNNWPSFEDTYKTHLSTLYERVSKGQENYINDQLNSIMLKKERYDAFIFSDPVYVLQYLGASIVFSCDQGLETIFLLGNTRHNPTGLLDLYHEYFGNQKIEKHQSICESDSLEDMLEKRMTNCRSAIRESVCRLLSSEVINAYLNNGFFRCPIGEVSCPYRNSKCNHLTDLNKTKVFCRMIITRNSKGKAFHPDMNIGNYPDCMLYNYLLDYNYKIEKISHGNL